jgi:ABC-2 type transport system ATP-binding protein
MEQRQSMIQLKDLKKTYGSLTALDSISVTIGKGRITGLLGANGAGKTTLISLCCGLVEKDSGKIIIDGTPLENNIRNIRSISGLTPQTPALYPKLTVAENLRFFGSLLPLSRQQMERNISFVIEAAGLHSVLDRRCCRCSGGMVRRLNLAISLLNRPRILYLDEPTVGIDPKTRKSILELIKEIRATSDCTMLYASHYIDEIEDIADDILIVDNGRIILSGTKEQVTRKGTKIIISTSGISSELEEMFESYSDIEINRETIVVDTDLAHYGTLITVFNQCEKHECIIHSIETERHSLENLFLQLTADSSEVP